jgi:hypothetical protein
MCGRLLSVLVLLAGIMGVAGAAEQKYLLTERLNRQWTRELVTYPLTADKGACVAESVRLTGPTGPLPVQLTQVERWPDTPFVKSAMVAFVVEDLAPLAEHTYTLTYGPAAAPNPFAGDLKITRGETTLEAVTSLGGVRLLLGAKAYEPAAAPGAVPGPVQGMRLGDGAWYGGSRLYGEAAVTGCTARVVESGPVLVRVEYQYAYANGNLLTLMVQLHAQSNRLAVDTTVKDSNLKDGWDLLLTGLPPLALQFMPEVQQLQTGTRDVKGWKEKAIADYKPGLVTNLSPWGDWWSEYTQPTFYLKFVDDARELMISRQEAGTWVTPGGERNKHVPLMKGDDGALFLRVSNASGARKWTIGENPNWEAKLPRIIRPQFVMVDDVEALNVVKELALDWPASDEKHPRMFLSAEEFAEAAQANPAAVKALQDVTQLRRFLSLYGSFDTMRYAAAAACWYDGIVDTELLTPAERKLARAQMAYLAYRLYDPMSWSPERGFNSGNPNMTVANILNQGMVACVLRDHPMAKAWIQPSLKYMDAWLNRLDAKGYWPESGHYGRVSVSKLILFAVCLQRAGFHDYFTDPRMTRMLLFYEKQLTPTDPQRVLTNSPPKEPKFGRLSPPIGRGSHGSNWGLGGVGARATTKSAPELSRVLQWSYLQGNGSTMVGEGMSGYDVLYPDRALPAQAPADWTSEYLPSIGPLFRSGVATPEENYLLLVTKNPTNPDGEIWPSEVGDVAIWFAKGKPISRRFTSVPDMNQDHGLLINRVMLATDWKAGKTTAGGYYTKETPLGFSAQPRADYVAASYDWLRPWMQVSTPPSAVPSFPTVEKVGALPPAGQPPVNWQRQALWVHDDTPGGVQYLVLRDTLTGGQPTQWQFWTTSEKIGTPADVADRAAFLAEKPGDKSVDASELHGDRFTAVGTLGVDVEYYIASPTDTPRHTLRYSSRAPGYHVRDFMLSQDLLHLQLRGDGAYFVALFPRLAAEDVPAFTTLGEGTVIKVSGKFGTDYAFLAGAKTAATAEDARFDGTAASVQWRATGLVLALAAPGTVVYQGYALTAPMPATLRAAPEKLAVTFTAEHAGGEVVLQAPGAWKLEPAKGVTLKQDGNRWLLTIPANCPAVTLVKAKR